MTTIKSYTDLEQSRKLAEILPLESADMCYKCIGEDPYDVCLRPYSEWREEYKGLLIAKEVDVIPCWSLAALFSILPNEIITDNRFECHYQIHIRQYDGGDNTTLYQIAYGNNRGLSGSWHDMINTGEKENLVDCCVQMILNLHEQNLL